MSKKKKQRRDVSNTYETFATNPVVQPDDKTEKNVPIPSAENVELSRDYSENHEA